MHKFIYTVLFLILTGCGTLFKKPEPVTNIDLKKELYKKAELYKAEQYKHQDEYGFILSDECDSLLFSGLLSAAAPELNIQILAAKNQFTEQWHRRPNHDCGPEFRNSRSTISRDMLIGLFYHLYYNQDLDTAVDLLNDLRANKYMLQGEGTPGELFVLPSYLNTLALIIKMLGGPEYKLELNMPVTYANEPGYVNHINTWHIMLRAELLDTVTEDELTFLKLNAESQPKNPLFIAAYHKYTDGNLDKAINLLLNTEHYPSDTLPTTANHCDKFVIEREYSDKDWKPCTEKLGVKEHTGAELIIIYELLIE